VPRELCELGSLTSLQLSGNPIEGIDQEIYSKPNGKTTLVSLRDYFRGLSSGSVVNDQVKLVLVGNGRVGKTSVAARLIDNVFDEAQPSTHGIHLRQWALHGVAQDRLQGAPLRISMWDFGGQDIYHATHRLFMKTRALFLLVWDKDTEEERFSLDELGERYENFRLPYWIDYIKALSGSPVIVVQNKVDTLQDKRPTYGIELQSVYPPPRGILDYVHVSARRSERNGMPGLVDSIALALDGLESVGRQLPEQWVKVRDRVTAIDRRYLEFAEFAEICESVGLHGTEPVSVANFLHEAGVIFYQPPSFADRIILDQRWAIDAVYALFDRRGAAYTDLKIAGRNGLTLELLKRKVWRQFSNDEHQLLLEFMQSCEMCFELSKGIYYVPQLLPDERPSRVALRWRTPTEYCVQISYPFLHRAIIDRFLVRAGRLGADTEPEMWKDGVTIFDPVTQSEAMVEALPDENRILAQAKGPAAITLLNVIAQEFDTLHAGFPAVTAVSADGGQHFVELDVLRQHVKAQTSSVPAVNGQLIDLSPLMAFAGGGRRRDSDSGVLLSRARVAPRQMEAATDDIFLSYAWGDPSETGESREAIVDRLYDTLLANHFKVIRDKKDNGYRKFISDFMRRIGRGRLVVVVISDKYLRSPYCMYELLEIYEHSQFKDRVMPIVLGDAKLYDLSDRLDYVLHWKQKKEALAEKMLKLGMDAFSSDGAFREFDLYYRRVFNNIDKLTSLLGDWNALRPSLLEENNFARLLEEITEELNQPVAKRATAERSDPPHQR
jgi:internalin A